MNHHFAENGANIIFCLAQNLPTGIAKTQWSQFGTTLTQGQPGITYMLDTFLTTFDLTQVNSFSRLYDSLPFPADQYLNIYVVEQVLSGMGSVDGIANVGPSLELIDGIGIKYSAFFQPSLGKTLIHEAGHWLGLFHVFDEQIQICDTYPQDTATAYLSPSTSISGCNTAYITTLTCAANPPYNQGENHMDYHHQGCLRVLTKEQVLTMRKLLDNDRSFIHSDLNLINTGVRRIGGCLDSNIVTAQFTISADEVCSETTVSLQGANIRYYSWAWSYSWDTAKNNNAPMPTGAVSFSNNNGSSSTPFTNITIDSAGIWDIILTVTHIDTSNGNTTSTTLSDSLELSILDCSISDQRSRITMVFDTSDWNIATMSIDNIPPIVGDTAIGYIVIGSAFINSTQNEIGVMMRVDATGRTVWRKEVKIPGGDVRLFDVVSNVHYSGMTDCYALTGYAANAGSNVDTNLLFLIADRDGDVLFQEIYPIKYNGTLQPYSVGLHVVQLSDSFNRDFAVVGFAGEGASVLDNKAGFVVGISVSSGVVWSRFFETNYSLPTAGDFDLAENITEITANFGNGLESALVISGNYTAFSPSYGSFLSCLTIDNQIITEKWRRNFEHVSSGGEAEVVQMIATDFDNGRLFTACHANRIHGTYIFELNPNGGQIKTQVQIVDLYGNDLVLNGNHCILSAIGYSSKKLVMFKIPLPPPNSSTWNMTSTIARQYDNSIIAKPFWGGLYNNLAYILKPQDLVISPNGGYTIIREIALDSPSTTLAGVHSTGLIFNKIDELLVGACIGVEKFRFGSLYATPNNPLIADSIALSIAPNTDSISSIPISTPCYQGTCSETYLTTAKTFEKCEQGDPIVLTSTLSSIGNFSYQWSPAAGLNDSTILEPLCFSDTAITYTLTVTDTITQCVVLVGTYNVQVIDTVFHTYYFDKCYNDSIVLISADTSIINNYDYQWSPSSFLSSTNILEPTCFNPTDRTYALVATHRNSCLVKKYQYVVDVTSVKEILIPCITSNTDFYSFVSPEHLIELDTLLIKRGIFDLTGTWVDPTPHPTYPLSNHLDSLNVLHLAPSPSIPPLNGVFNELHYIYGGDSLCDTLVIVRFGLQSAFTNATNNTSIICDGQTLTFVSTHLDSTWRHEWRFIDNFNNVVIDVFSDTTSYISYSFSYGAVPLANHQYTVQHRVFNTQCSGDNVFFPVTSILSSSFTIFVTPPITTITRNCTNTLSVPYSSNVQWYKMPNIPQSTGSSFTPTTSGQYYAIITTQNCVIYSDTINFNPITPLSISTTQTNNLCFGAATGTATISVSNGVVPYTYTWSNGQTDATATGLAAGTYQITVNDACGFLIDTVIITEPTPLVVNATALTPPCAGTTSGTAIVTASGGTPTYTYLWSDNQTNSTATNLSTGTYTVTVTDSVGCTGMASVNIIANPSPILTISTTADTICIRDSVTLTASGANAYIWSHGLANGATLAPLTTTTYTVTGTDTSGCQTTTSITIVVTPRFTVTQTVISATPNTSVTIMQIVCALGTGVYDMQTTIPAGWTLTNGSTTISGNLGIGICDTHYITIQIPTNPNLCDLDIENCVNLTAGTCAPVQNCLIINTGVMGLATVIPTTVTTFSQAIQNNLLRSTASSATSPQRVVFQGNIIHDIQMFPGANTYTFVNSDIQIAPNVQITIETGAELILNRTNVHGCNQLWRSITVNQRGRLGIFNNSTIRDALYAVEILHDDVNTAASTAVIMQNSTFRNNYAAVYTKYVMKGYKIPH